MVFTVHIALDAPPAGEGRPAEPIGSFGGFHHNWFQAISHHTLQVSFINDARKSEFGKCVIKLDQDVCWILLEYSCHVSDV